VPYEPGYRAVIDRKVGFVIVERDGKDKETYFFDPRRALSGEFADGQNVIRDFDKGKLIVQAFTGAVIHLDDYESILRDKGAVLVLGKIFEPVSRLAFG
jgi:hypothetical protein